MKGKYEMRAVVTFVVEADNRAAAHIVAVDALTAAELDGFDLADMGVAGDPAVTDARPQSVTFVPPASEVRVNPQVAGWIASQPDGERLTTHNLAPGRYAGKGGSVIEVVPPASEINRRHDEEMAIRQDFAGDDDRKPIHRNSGGTVDTSGEPDIRTNWPSA